MNFDVSLVMCTCNRAARLESTLAHVQTLVMPAGVNCEIIAVDNRSTDNTAQVICDFAAGGAWPIRYVYEACPGLGAARNAGVAASNGEIVAFFDDDVFPARDWIAAILREFSQDADLAGLGGPVRLHNPLDYPITVRTGVGRYQLSTASDLVTGIAGCNMAFRRDALVALDGFDPDFGAGSAFMSSEDTELLVRALKRGLKLMYSPEVVVSHDHGRRTKAQVDVLIRGYVVGRGAMYGKHILGGDRSIGRMAYWEVRANVKDTVKAICKGESPRQPVRYSWFLLLGMMRYLRVRLVHAVNKFLRERTGTHAVSPSCTSSRPLKNRSRSD